MGTLNQMDDEPHRPRRVVPLRWATVALLLFAVPVTVSFVGVVRLLDEVHDNQVNGCRLNNSTNQQFIQVWNDTYDALVELGADQESIEPLRAVLPDPRDTDRDCTGDGTLDAGDYAPPPRPASTD